MKINILDSKIYNRIAAGEVIERPASIVKELIENSIDAKAGDIIIEIKEGGVKQIKVSDNGCGIERDYVKTAFLPHATSKISSIDDLQRIDTLGFRGEALASIASVSMITLKTKPAYSEAGTLIELKGDLITQFSECAMPDGSVFMVENLFFNTPARAKFLKSAKTEESEITNTVSRFIIANPDISFKYIVDGKTVFDYYKKDLITALYSVYGKDIYENVLEINYEKNGYKLYGYIGKPSFSKANRSYQTLIINGRFVSNSLISTAVFNAYGGLLMTRRYPFFAINFNLPHDLVDVNVHPNKSDVRFADANHIYGIFYNAVFNCLNNVVNTGENVKSDENLKNNNAENSETDNFHPKGSAENLNTAAYFTKPKIPFNEGTSDFDYKLNKKEPIDLKVSDSEPSENSAAEKIINEQANPSNSVNEQMPVFNQEALPIEFEDYKIIGTAFNTYIILEQKDEILLIDQHAAAERILYDKLKNAVNNKELAVQTLIMPYVLNVNSLEFNFIEENLEAFKALGFNIEQFGNNSFKVSEIPIMLERLDFEKFFNNLLNEEVNIKFIKSSDIIKEKLLQSACKASIKAGDNLHITEIENLLKSLKNKVLFCPHGRPIIIKQTRTEIEKWFKRIV